MSNITTATGPKNLWSSNTNSTLSGTNFNDILHAIHNQTTMTGGLGRDHFHVNMTAGSAVTGTKINDFNATQGDRLVLGGITDFDANKLAVTYNADGKNYDISYNGTFVATVNLQYTPVGGTAVDWNPDLAQATAAITKMVRGGHADAKADYLYGTDEAQTFRYAGRNLNIVDFSVGDEFELQRMADEYYLKYGSLDTLVAEVKGQGESRYITVTGTGGEYVNVKLKADEVTDDTIAGALSDIKGALGLA